MNNLYATNDGVKYGTNDMMALASLMHSDGYNEGDDVLKMVGSAALNAHQESPIAVGMPDLIAQNFSHAQSDPNFIDANTMNFKTKEDENHFKRSLQLASALIGGHTPKTHGGTFYGKVNHVRNLVRNKAIDMNSVEHVAKVKGKKSNFKVFKQKAVSL